MAHRIKREPVFREDGIIEIRLTKGYVAVVDFDDIWVTNFNWSALTTPSGLVYAHRGRAPKQLLHRVLTDAPPDMEVDHEDGDGLNCRRSNLRVVTHKENLRNRRINRNNTSGLMGVSKDPRSDTWLAQINGIRLGAFNTKEQASAARIGAERALWGIQPRRKHMHY